jgi:hypothetical protein
MRRVAWLLVLLIVGGGFSVLADCGCSQGVEPECYVTFRANELIAFSTIFPVDFFTQHAVTETPFVLGWLVESADGSAVRTATFDDVVGWPRTFVWDLADDEGHDVGPGFYRIHVSTTAGVVSAAVRLIACCNPCLSCWSCCVCTTCPAAGGRCPTPCGEPYLVLSVDSTKACCAATFGVWTEWVPEGP